MQLGLPNNNNKYDSENKVFFLFETKFSMCSKMLVFVVILGDYIFDVNFSSILSPTIKLSYRSLAIE